MVLLERQNLKIVSAAGVCPDNKEKTARPRVRGYDPHRLDWRRLSVCEGGCRQG